MAQANHSHLCSTLHLCRFFPKCWKTDDHVCFCSRVRDFHERDRGGPSGYLVESLPPAASSEPETVAEGAGFTRLQAARGGRGVREAGLQPPEPLGQLPRLPGFPQPRLTVTEQRTFQRNWEPELSLCCQLAVHLRRVSSPLGAPACCGLLGCQGARSYEGTRPPRKVPGDAPQHSLQRDRPSGFTLLVSHLSCGGAPSWQASGVYLCNL